MRTPVLAKQNPVYFSHFQGLLSFDNTVELKNDYVLGFIICEILTVIALQDWVGWGFFTVVPGYPRRANGDSQHLEARP